MFNAKKQMIFIACCLYFAAAVAAGPYPPRVGQPGSTAIYKDDPSFVGWATGITVQRGFVDINNHSFGFVSFGNDANALGQAQGGIYDVVSLGDGGTATLTFAHPIMNGPGFDFAVFENSYDDFFLELAFVEVSSDGINFFRFPAVSLTPTNVQTGSYGTLDATNLNNLAGKYRGGYGTPFDLNELKGVSPLLDVNSIAYVRIIDVVGFVEPPDVYGDGIVDLRDYSVFAAAYMSKVGDKNWNQNCDISSPPNGVINMFDFKIFMSKWLKENNYAGCDSFEHQVTDPWPTPFNTGGFDLDAVGVINQKIN